MDPYEEKAQRLAEIEQELEALDAQGQELCQARADLEAERSDLFEGSPEPSFIRVIRKSDQE